ncbi:MAG: extracellular solute-binding protein [Deltaproteobacteria bacterium]|nr:extracellular solute-binding protein [Deltaproteobacteria bacterium]
MSWGKLELAQIVTRAVVILLLSFGLAAANDTYAAAPADEKTKVGLLEKAKKEGKVVLYTGQTIEDLKEITPLFEKKYPFVKVDIFRSGAAKLFARALSEYRAGKHLADIFGSSFWATQQYFEKGLLGNYKSPEGQAIPEYCKDKEGYWSCDYINIGVIAYNTKLVPREKAPRSYQDLLDPWWKGKIGLDDTGFRWYGSMLKIMGKEKGQNFMQRLAHQNISFRRGQNLLAQLLQAGEFAAVINLYNNDIEQLKMKGAPVDWVAPLDQPTVITPHAIALAKNPPHPNAARLYIDFILSREGQEILSRLNNVPARSDVPPNPARLMLGADGKRLKFLSVDLEFAKGANELADEFRKLFMGQEVK